MVEEFSKLLWEMNKPVWERICKTRVEEYLGGNYHVGLDFGPFGMQGYVVWHEDDSVRYLDDLGYKGKNANTLKRWFREACNTEKLIRLNVMGRNEKLKRFYENHGFKVCEETPYLYIMERSK